MNEDEMEMDTCQNCGKYFSWTQTVIEENKRLGEYSQRCLRCCLLDKGDDED